MATTNLKESLQCFAFAYFAGNPTIDKEHQQRWTDIFSSDSEIDGLQLRSTYGNYLSSTFSATIFDNVLKKYRSGVTKQGKISVKPAVKKVYLVVKKVVDTSFFKSSLDKYLFLDQTDQFTQTAKDACLSRIAKAFRMTSKADLLSPIDLFAVRKDKMTDILTQYNDHIINASDAEILANMAWGTQGKNTYRTISNKFFANRYLVGISLKLPETIKGAGVLKIVGTEAVDKHLLDFVDPYTKLIAAMVAHPSQTSKLIDEVVDIEFDNFRISSDILSWEYPITFRYKDVKDPRFLGPATEPLYKNNLRFKLMTWSNAGFNGQWYKGQGAPGNWTGGAGVVSLGELFVKYNEYSTILNEIIDMREESLNYTLTGKNNGSPNIPEKLKSLYDQALIDIRQKKIITKAGSKDLIKFLSQYSRVNLYDKYQTEFIKRATKPMKASARTVTTNSKRLIAHYTASQCAWFLFRGGESLHKHLKKRMFLSLFGLITKSGYKIFQGNENTIMEDYIKKKFTQNKRSVEAYFNAAPHIVLS
jgi:hypothetical protein